MLRFHPAPGEAGFFIPRAAADPDNLITSQEKLGK